MFVNVKRLPATVQDALKSVGYGKADVEVKIVRTMILASPGGGDGFRGFTTIVKVATGQRETVHGSWGGSNMFVATPVDDDKREYTLPAGAAVIKGQRGGGLPVMATVYVAAAGELPGSGLDVPKLELSDKQHKALAIFDGLKSSYRAEYMSRARIGADVVDSLVELGLLKRNKAGATSITTEGKNARDKSIDVY